MVDLDRYPNSFDDFGTPTPPQKPKGRLWLWLVIYVALVVIAISTAMIFSQTLVPDWMYKGIPFVPHRLESITFEVNNEPLICKASETCRVRPPDKIQIKGINTDGTVSPGIELHSPDFDPASIAKEARSFTEIFPQLDFDNPREFVIEVFWFRWNLGKVTLVAKWTAQDWLERARAADSLEKKEYFLLKALEEAPDNVLMRNQLANVFLQQKKYSRAAEQYEILLQGQKSRVFLERLARSYALAGNKQKAVEHYAELISHYPERGYVKEWFDYLKKSMSAKEIIQVAETYGHKLPQNVQGPLLVFVSDVCAAAKNWECVAEYSEKALKSPAKSPTLAYNAAAALFQKKDYGKASEYLKRYLADHPNDLEAQKMLALCYENLKQWNDAEAVYRKMVEGGHASEEIISRWIDVIEKLNDRSKLIVAYQKLVQLKPQDPAVWYNLGVLQSKEGKRDEARKAFEKVAQLKPNDVNTLKYLRNIYHDTKNAAGEKDILKKLINIEPGVEAHYNDFFALSDKNRDYDEVINVLNTCVSKIPKSVTCYNNLLYMYLKQKKEKEAAQVLERLIELQPGKPELLLQAAKLYYNQKNYAKASDLLKRYLDKKPDDETAQDLYLEIRKKAAMQAGDSQPSREKQPAKTGPAQKKTPSTVKKSQESQQ